MVSVSRTVVAKGFANEAGCPGSLAVRFFLDSPQTRKHIADIGIRPLLDDTVRFISRNPRATTGIGIVCLFLSMPFILFVLFAMCTLMVTFTGFLIVEGALITFASVLLFTFVGAMLLTGICGATAVTAAYFGCHFVYRMVDYHRRTAGAAGHNGGGGDGADRGGAAANDVG